MTIVIYNGVSLPCPFRFLSKNIMTKILREANAQNLNGKEILRE